MKERIDEHDMTKKMMAMLRGGYKSIITEAEGGMTMGGAAQTVASAPVQSQPTQDSAPNDVPQKEVSKAEAEAGVDADAGTLKDETNKFQEIVDPSIQINSFKIYPNEKNVTIDGIMLNGKAEFTFNLLENGPYIDTASIQLDDNINDTIKKMNGHFENWKKEWSKKITTEYQQK